MAIRDSYVVPNVLPATGLGAGTVLQGVLGKGLGSYINQVWEFTVSGTPSGGTPTLDIYIQTSIDGGTTWYDIANVHYTTAQNTQVVPIAGDVAGPAAPFTAQDAALTANTIKQGPWGDQIRLKIVVVLGGGATGTYTVAANVMFR